MHRLAAVSLVAVALAMPPLPGRAGEADGPDPRLGPVSQIDPFPTLRKLRPRPDPETLRQIREEQRTLDRIKPYHDAFKAVQAITNAIFGGN